ncbi:MAG: COX15/CtaA family protein [Deltaproteobacteria bacterium]|nr:COX15/CtaA family protein [Deltaproteobacteria bacterium]
MHRLAITTALATFLLLIVGGAVHATGSSLACPDWPLCYGQLMPEMKGGVLYEHSHRLLATLVGLLTIALTVVLVRKRKDDRALGWLGPLALVAVIVQGVLGGITVLYRLPTLVSTAHLALSMLYFLLLIYIAFRTAPPGVVARVTLHPTQRRWVWLAATAVYLQVILGGLVRHTGAGLSCLDIPLCRGTIWPAYGPVLAQVHMLHRLAAVLVSIVVILASARVLRGMRGQRGAFVRFLALAAPVLVSIQVGLGIWSVWAYLGTIPVTAHLAVGALIVGTLQALYLATKAQPVAITEASKGSETAVHAGIRPCSS